jgi:hypothetical protein
MDLIGIRVMMEDYELIELLGGNPVHLSKKGYTKLAESLINIVETPGALFAGEKRGREEGESVGDTEIIGSWHYKKNRSGCRARCPSLVAGESERLVDWPGQKGYGRCGTELSSKATRTGRKGPGGKRDSSSR